MTTLGRGCLVLLAALLVVVAWYRHHGVGDFEDEPDYSAADPHLWERVW